MQKEKTKLKSWLLIKPLMFTLWFLILGTILGFAYSFIQSIFNFESMIPLYILCALTFILPACYIIQKLPHEKMGQNDFVAITNGAGFISIIASLVAILTIGFYGENIQRDMLMMYILHPTMFYGILLFVFVTSLYLIGVALSGIYAKYKRATTLGISPWRVILSMPFTFLLMWTPGYLIQDKEIKSELEIKSSWFKKLNKWVLANFNNTLFMFLLLLFFKCVIAGTATLVLSALLLILYVLWYVKHKSDFIKNINKGYALTAVGINLAILFAVIIQRL
ncbi:MAG: hypothetical protein ACLRFF_01970 [Alphaproteobacteria bacterium]